MHELDQQALQRAQSAAAAGYSDADFFCAEANTRLLERLELFSLTPARVLELGAGTDGAAAGLAQIYPTAQLVQIDSCLTMLATSGKNQDGRVCADGQRLPLSDASFDIVFSNMMLPGCADPEQIFREVHRALRPPGVFLFSTLGPDSLKELRRAWTGVDNFTHVHEFADMHNIGDALVQAGFTEPVMDVELLTVTYADLNGLIRDLRGIAATNFSRNRNPGLTTPARWQLMQDRLEHSRNSAGRLEVTLEIVTGQAWAAEASRGVQMADGEAHFPVSRLRPNR